MVVVKLLSLSLFWPQPLRFFHHSLRFAIISFVRKHRGVCSHFSLGFFAYCFPAPIECILWRDQSSAFFELLIAYCLLLFLSLRLRLRLRLRLSLRRLLSYRTRMSIAGRSIA